MEILTKVKALLPLNWALLGNPVNWIIVFLMVAIAGAGLALVITPTAQTEE